MKRAASLKYDCVNVRVGPGEEYPIEFIYKKKGIPVFIIIDFNTWRKIVDKDGEVGWVMSRSLSTKQTIIVTKNTVMYTSNSDKSVPLAVIEKNVIAEVIEIKGDFIKIKLNCKKGWISKKNVWGVSK